MVTIEDQCLPLVSLAHLLNVGTTTVTVSDASICLVVMSAGTQRLAVAVDEFLSEQDALIRDLPAPANVNRKVAGGVFQQDGSVCLVLNPIELLDSVRRSAEPIAFTTGTPAAEHEVKASGRAYKTGRFPFSANGRARTMGEANGFVKFIADAETDELLGCHMIGPNVSELIAEVVLAFEYRGSSEDVGITVHSHPTLSEATKEAALAVLGRAIHI